MDTAAITALREALVAATTPLVRDVDRLGEDDLRAPSLLPGWSRAHVVAHLALNAEGLTGVLDGAAHGRDVPMYRSDAGRDADIDDLAAADPSDLRERLLAGVRRFRAELEAMPEQTWAASFSRTPGAPRIPLAAVPDMRLREVYIHHADLDIGYTAAAWPADFCTRLLDAVTVDHAGSPDSPAFTVRAADLDRAWPVGGDTPVVSGPAYALGWWLTGRGTGATLHTDGGPLPALGPWRRPAPPPASC